MKTLPPPSDSPASMSSSSSPIMSTGWSRRRFLASAAAATATATAAMLPTRAWAAEPAESPVNVIRRTAVDATITTTSLRAGLSLLEGSGGNITALAGADGVLLVDAGITASRPRIVDALRKLSPGPVRLLVNTHWHFDHTDGNEWLHQSGARVVAHSNTVRRLSATVRVEDWNFTFEPSPAAALPTIHFDRELRLRANGQNMLLEAYAPAHTDTDIGVFFEEANVLSVGDTWWNGHYPFIDYSTGGSIDGTVRAAEFNVRRASRDTLVVPGHGPAGGVNELTEFRDMLVDVRERVAKLKRQGRTLAEIIAAKPTQRYDAKWGGFVINPATFATLVYQGV